MCSQKQDIICNKFTAARQYLDVRTRSPEKASEILQLTVKFINDESHGRFPTQVIDFFRTSATGKSWWYNLTDLMDFVSAVRSGHQSSRSVTS